MEFELTELIDKIIGHYSSIGETNYDNKSLEKLKPVHQLLDHIMFILLKNVERASCHKEWSIQEIGEKSKEIIMTILEDYKSVYCYDNVKPVYKEFKGVE